METKAALLDFILKYDLHSKIYDLLTIYPNWNLNDIGLTDESLIRKGISLYIMKFLMNVDGLLILDPVRTQSYSNGIIRFFKNTHEMINVIKFYYPLQNNNDNLIDLESEDFNEIWGEISDVVEIKKTISERSKYLLQKYYLDDNNNLKIYERDIYQPDINSWVERITNRLNI
jgi:hypothetical protein